MKRFIVKPSARIDAVFERAASLGVLFIVDDGVMVGWLTDAAIRRHILDGGSLDGVVADLATAVGKSKAQVTLEPESAPVSAVIEGGRLVSIAVRPPIPPPIAVVMAGGRGQRLRPITDKVPKPLLKVGNSSIVERILRGLGAAGITDCYLSVNYKAREFESRLRDGKQLGIELRYLKEESKLGTAGALSLLPKKPKVPVLVTNADILTRLDYARIVEFHRTEGGAATMAAIPYVTQVPYGVARNQGARLVGIEEKPDISVLCNAGIYVLEPEALSVVRKGKPLDMPDLLSRLVEKGKQVNVFPVIERWFDIGSPEDFKQVLMEFATYEEE
ncbi:MAG TPA: sugar phosphate nucleotidyltransferase [Actinomycetota bacterium]|nr:sugar phosphate nucleotidyltransferase [Actinomycetota bacterium]